MSYLKWIAPLRIKYNEHNRLVFSKCLRLEGVIACYYKYVM